MAKPLGWAGSAVSASWTGAKIIGSSILDLASGTWNRVSGTASNKASGITGRIWGTMPVTTLATLPSTLPIGAKKQDNRNSDDKAEAKSAGKIGMMIDPELFRVTPLHPVPPALTPLELAQVAVPLASKLSEQYGLFGHKPLSPKLADQQGMQHAEQLQEIETALNEMRNHSILKRRLEYRMAKEAFEQAQLRFKNYFQARTDASYRVTESENSEVSRLIDIAQHALTVAEAFHIEIAGKYPGFIEIIEKLETEKERVAKELKKMERSFANKIKNLQKQQNAIIVKGQAKDITPAQEAKLDAEWDCLTDMMTKISRAQETMEPIYGALNYLLEKISDQLEAGCLPDQLDSVQNKLDLVKEAIAAIITGNTHTEEGVLAKVIAIVDTIREKEATAVYSQFVDKTAALKCKQKALTDFFVTDRETVQLAASVASHLASAPIVTDHSIGVVRLAS